MDVRSADPALADGALPPPAASGSARPVAAGPRGARAITVGLLALVAALVALSVLPTLLWRMPEPQPISLSGLEGQVSGTYVVVTGGLLKLVPYADRLDALPGHVPATEPRPEILIRARQLDVPEAYSLWSWQGDRSIAVSRAVRDGHTIAMRPLTPLSPGTYYIKAARDSAERADDYFYFKVDEATGR